MQAICCHDISVAWVRILAREEQKNLLKQVYRSNIVGLMLKRVVRKYMYILLFTVLIGQTYPALSLDAMEQMTIQMDIHTYKTCKTKEQQIHLDFLDRDILSGNNNNTITNTLNKDEYNIKEETSIGE